MPGLAIPDPSGQAKLFIVFGNGTFPTAPNYGILKTDYDKYSLVFSCRQFQGGLYKVEFAQILSRRQSLSESFKDKLLEVFSRQGIKADQFHFTPQGPRAGCSYGQIDGKSKVSAAFGVEKIVAANRVINQKV